MLYIKADIIDIGFLFELIYSSSNIITTLFTV